MKFRRGDVVRVSDDKVRATLKGRSYNYSDDDCNKAVVSNGKKENSWSSGEGSFVEIKMNDGAEYNLYVRHLELVSRPELKIKIRGLKKQLTYLEKNKPDLFRSLKWRVRDKIKLIDVGDVNIEIMMMLAKSDKEFAEDVEWEIIQLGEEI